MIALSAAVGTGLAGTVWLEWSNILDILEPLPKPRSVALLAWPAEGSPALLSTILDSIGRRLARAEPYVKDLLILTPKDAPVGSPPVDSLEKSESILGANLVLTASLRQDVSQARLFLQLLEARSQRVLRKGVVSSSIKEINSMAEKGSQEAASLLRLPRQEIPLNDPEELRNVPLDVLQAYSDAEQAMNEPNRSGLQQAIGKYQHALELDPHFALGYAKLAKAYIDRYLITHEPANIDLAERNASNALLYNPNSAMGLLSQALVFSYTGKTADASSYFAKALKADPRNPQILISKAEALLNQSKLADAIQVYNDILVDRPNYWPAYNNSGVALTREAKYEDAAKAFARAGMAAPKVALPMANLGQTYIQLGRLDDARNALNESISRAENEDAYLGLGDIDFGAGKYAEALKMYSQASKLDPKFHLIQRNMGDCYAMLGNLAMEKECYRRAARLVSDSLKIDPQSGLDWANLAFYHAKIGDASAAESDIENADAHGAKDVAAKFMIVQALAVMGKKQEAVNLLLWCIDKGLSPADVDLAIDLKSLRSDPRYLARLGNHNRDGKASPS
jgi:tetratricopeptide (TPR) repeat protein